MTTVHDKRKEVLRSNSAPKQPSTWRTDGGEETVVIKEAPLDSAAKVQQVVVQIGFLCRYPERRNYQDWRDTTTKDLFRRETIQVGKIFSESRRLGEDMEAEMLLNRRNDWQSLRDDIIFHIIEEMPNLWMQSIDSIRRLPLAMPDDIITADRWSTYTQPAYQPQKLQEGPSVGRRFEGRGLLKNINGQNNADCIITDHQCK